MDLLPITLCDPHLGGHRPLFGRHCSAISSWIQGATRLLPSNTGAPGPEQPIQGSGQCMGVRTTRPLFWMLEVFPVAGIQACPLCVSTSFTVMLELPPYISVYPNGL